MVCNRKCTKIQTMVTLFIMQGLQTNFYLHESSINLQAACANKLFCVYHLCMLNDDLAQMVSIIGSRARRETSTA